MSSRDAFSQTIPSSVFARPRPCPTREECHFYHSFDLPDGNVLVGDWDMRGRFADYIGHVDLKGKHVLDIGTASGFLSFESERAGADVVSFDADSTRNYTRLPHSTGRFSENPDLAIHNDNKWLSAVKNSYWFTYHALSSKNRVYYGNLFDMPVLHRQFEVTIVGQFLVHNRSGIDVLMAAAATTTDYLIVTEGLFDCELPAAQFLGNASNNNDYYSQWKYSAAFYREIGKMLGFRVESFDIKTFACNHVGYAENIELGVFVFRRV